MTRPSSWSDERGSALVTVVVFAAILTILVAAGLTITKTSIDEVEAERHAEQSLYAAEAGVNAALTRVAVAYRTGDEMPCNQGERDDAERVYAGRFWSRTTNNDDDTLTVLATGMAGGAARTLEVILQPTGGSPLDHAMYAGNLSRDAAYELELGGTGGQRDDIEGDVYSGGDIVLSGDAQVGGDLTAGGTITGGIGRENVLLDVPQMLTIDYEEFHDVDVAEAFEGAPRRSHSAGGTAGQLSSSDAAHIFRKNPSDRTSNTGSTEKDDYFLEDPYESVRTDSRQDGSDAYEISLPEEANNGVYFIDGNLWLHNLNSYSFKIRNEGSDPTRVTFVVKGNVYFSDNFFYDDPDMDGVAFLALSDPDVEDSGNIYFGDPSFGTMQFAEALLFAENNFFDVNLDASGSSKVEVRGSMTAGNQVAIDRDYGRAHTKLKLTFDERQRSGFLNLPGIPAQADHPVGFTVAAWREVPTPASFDLCDVEVATSRTHSGPPPESFQVTPRTPPQELAKNGEDWRERWKEMFGSEWKNKKRKGKWSTGVELAGKKEGGLLGLVEDVLDEVVEDVVEEPVEEVTPRKGKKKRGRRR